MLIWNPSKLTTKGKALLAKAQAGRCTIKITKAQTGSGQYSSGEATDTRTSLKAPVQTLPIHSKEIQNGSTLVLKVPGRTRVRSNAEERSQERMDHR